MDAALRVARNQGTGVMIIKELQAAIFDATAKKLDLTACDDIVTLLRSRGYKLTAREATDRMLEACEDIESPLRAWTLMWEQCE